MAAGEEAHDMSIDNLGFIVAAYIVVWGGIAAYAISLARRRDEG